MEVDEEEEAAAAAAAGAPAAVAVAELRPLLAAVAGVGRAAGACLGRVCAALGVKKKLAGKKVAKGLEAFVAGALGWVAAVCGWVVGRGVKVGLGCSRIVVGGGCGLGRGKDAGFLVPTTSSALTFSLHVYE